MTNPYRLAYLATPYTNYQGGIERAFREACRLSAELIDVGWRIYSPIAHTHPIAIYGGLDPKDHSIWLPFNKVMMDAADTLIVAHMNGWEQSRGIAEEIKYFAAAGKPIFDWGDLETMLLEARSRG